MKVAEIWRYPVKTMAGEKLMRASVQALGTEGDRIAVGDEALLVRGRACVESTAAVSGPSA